MHDLFGLKPTELKETIQTVHWLVQNGREIVAGAFVLGLFHFLALIRLLFRPKG